MKDFDRPKDDEIIDYFLGAAIDFLFFSKFVGVMDFRTPAKIERDRIAREREKEKYRREQPWQYRMDILIRILYTILLIGMFVMPPIIIGKIFQ